jgi:hypothetical protein
MRFLPQLATGPRRFRGVGLDMPRRARQAKGRGAFRGGLPAGAIAD